VMQPDPFTATELARSVIDGLTSLGITEFVLAPGSRSAPLAFAAYDAAQRGALRLHTRIDERSASFLALGLTKVGRRAAVFCTSGTAVANLHPAALEAAHAGLGLVLISADRPARFRGTGANQTTDQVGLFGPLIPTLDIAAGDIAAGDIAAGDIAARDLAVRDDFLAAFVARARPAHLNLQFDEPLVPAASSSEWSRKARPAGEARPAGGPGPTGQGPTALPVSIGLGPRTVVVAGDDAGPPARVLAQEANWPLFAEPTSGCRTGDNVIRSYRLLLDGELGRQIQRVVVAGHPTLSRPVMRLLARAEMDVISMKGRGVWPERPFGVSGEFDQLRVDQPDEQTWLERWRQADRDLSARLDALLAAEPELTPYEVAGAVSAAVPPGGLLYVGASSPIRDLDLMVAKYAVGERRKVIANRGLAGIDGTVSSAIGAALGRGHGTRSLALMGDVTFLHDSNGLIVGPDEERPDLTIVVVNDDGGSIFATLEQGDSAYAAEYDKLFGTPHHVDIASLCAATRTPHWQATSLPELQQALANPNGGIEVIEVKVRRDNRRDLGDRINDLVTRERRGR
jgi:2-succinyl-5-enolpyruvyl-6-hydroxy-3-cyclohexene-1-carboxylate synthase